MSTGEFHPIGLLAEFLTLVFAHMDDDAGSAILSSALRLPRESWVNWTTRLCVVWGRHAIR
jgi:hypothetical protein